MSRRLVLILAFLLLLVCLQYPRFQQNSVRASDGYHVHNLNTGLNYSTIQESIDASETLNGHTILVDAGTYYGTIILNKSLHLTGQDKETTIIDGNGTEKVIVVMVDNTSVGNFTIQGGGFFPYHENSAIYVNSSNNVVANNILQNNNGTTVFLDSFSRKNTIENNVMINNWVNCVLNDSTENKVIGNRIEGGHQERIGLFYSSYNEIYSNVMSEGICGIELSEAYNNVMIDNMINDTVWSIMMDRSYYNSMYHNNFINNWEGQVYLFSSPGSNYFDNYLEGNYWSDYNGTDSNQDGIGDTPYVIDANNTDHYPLMGTFQSFIVHANTPPFSRLEEIEVISNSTIGNVNVSQAFEPTDYGWFLELTGVTGLEGTTGFCRITFPNDIINASYYQVLINGTFTSSSRIVGSNGTYTTVYFTYVHPVSGSIIEVFPEFPSFLVPLFMIAASLAVIVYKRRHST